MKKIAVTAEPIQEFRIPFEDTDIQITLRFLPVMSYWTISLIYKGKTVNFKKLSLGTIHLQGSNLPFDFVVSTNDGIDPYHADDFLERCELLLLERFEVEFYRGVELP